MADILSFEESRQAMLEEVRRNFKKIETKVIPFQDNGVPEFLVRLRDFSNKSRESTFMVG